MTSLLSTLSRPEPIASVTQSGTTCTVEVRGEIDMSTADDLRTAIEDALGHRPETLVVDLSDVAFVDSTGVRVLLTGDTRARANDVRYLLIRAREEVHRVFEVCGLDGRLTFVSQGFDAGSLG
jgi:anti-anti-sigma factor